MEKFSKFGDRVVIKMMIAKSAVISSHAPFSSSSFLSSPCLQTVASEKSGVVAAHVHVVLPDASLRNRFRNYRQIKDMIQASASKTGESSNGNNGDGGGGLSMAAAEIALRAFEYLAVAEVG